MFAHNFKIHQQKKLAKINQPVTVTDFVVHQTTPKGEYRSSWNNSYNQPRIERILDTIEMVASAANNYHQKENLELDELQNPVMKENNKNNITRVLFPEFFFYPVATPLSLDEFHSLFAGIEQLATKFHENLYLLISSVPLCDPNHKSVSNHAVHVQCGSLPKLDLLTKISPSWIDPVYPKMKNAEYSTKDREYAKNPAVPLLKQDASFELPYGKIIKCETAGGAQFYTAVDICLDHAYGEAERSFAHQIEQDARKENNEFIPNQISHVITSDTIEFFPLHRVAKHMVRADTEDTYNQKGYERVLLPQELKADLKINSNLSQKYPKLKLNCGDETINITNPPFGSSFYLSPHSATTLDRVDQPYLKKKIDQHNKDLLTPTVSVKRQLQAPSLTRG